METLTDSINDIVTNWNSTPKHNAKTLSLSIKQFAHEIRNFSFTKDIEFDTKHHCKDHIMFKHICGCFCPKCGTVFPF